MDTFVHSSHMVYRA